MYRLRSEFAPLALCLTFALAAAQQPPEAVAPPPLSLDQATHEAIANNLDLAAERLNISVAEASEITARLRPNPVLTVAGQTLNLLGAAYNPNTPLGPNQLNLHTDFPFERGHKREERIALAREEKTLAELGVREIMRQVVFGVQTAFVDVQEARERLNLAMENLRSLEGVVAVNEARFRSGDLAQVELERSRVAALQYRTAVQQAQLQVDQAKTRLQLLIGRKQTTPGFEVQSEIRRDEVATTESEIAKLALARRPDLLLSQRTQARSQADLRLQLANGVTDYTIGAEYTRQSAWGVSGSSVGVYFSVPLRVYNRNQGEIARAQREIALAKARSEATVVSIQSEVQRAWRQYTVSKELLASVERGMLAKAKSVRDTTEYSYRRGEASLVEFLDAQRAFNDVMQTFHEAQVNYARSLYLMDAVSGASVDSAAGTAQKGINQ
ncbi:MAG: TolC family protein [Bryobacteraceae bacterium]